MEFISEILADNSLTQWISAAVMFAGVFFLLRLVQIAGIKRTRQLFSKIRSNTANLIVDSLEKTSILVLIVFSTYAASRFLTLAEEIETFIASLTMIALFVQLGLWAAAFVDAWAKRYTERQYKTNPAAATTMGAMRLILIPAVWACVLLLILDNLGVNVTTLVAGLGIGGVAVALAAQNILGDLFASLSIVMDKPFLVGDFIILDSHMGTVEYIGLNSTRIRSLSGEQIIFSNADLLNSRIRNYGRMFERRVEVKIGVIYQTPREKLKMIPQIIREGIEAQEKTRFDRAHLSSYADSSIEFAYVYYVLSPDYNTYMDINQQINLYLHEKFEAEGIEFALPTQTLFLNISPETMEELKNLRIEAKQAGGKA